MEREELEEDISRYEAILCLVTDEAVVAAVTEMLAEARDQLDKLDDTQHRKRRYRRAG
jgi:hypothetical protein